MSDQVRCLMSFGRFGFSGVFSGVQSLEEAEEAGGFSDAAELDAESLDLDEEILNVDDLVSDQRLEEDADQADQTILELKIHMLMLMNGSHITLSVRLGSASSSLEQLW